MDGYPYCFMEYHLPTVTIGDNDGNEDEDYDNTPITKDDDNDEIMSTTLSNTAITSTAGATIRHDLLIAITRPQQLHVIPQAL